MYKPDNANTCCVQYTISYVISPLSLSPSFLELTGRECDVEIVKIVVNSNRVGVNDKFYNDSQISSNTVQDKARKVGDLQPQLQRHLQRALRLLRMRESRMQREKEKQRIRVLSIITRCCTRGIGRTRRYRREKRVSRTSSSIRSNRRVLLKRNTLCSNDIK